MRAQGDIARSGHGDSGPHGEIECALRRGDVRELEVLLKSLCQQNQGKSKKAKKLDYKLPTTGCPLLIATSGLSATGDLLDIRSLLLLLQYGADLFEYDLKQRSTPMDALLSATETFCRRSSTSILMMFASRHVNTQGPKSVEFFSENCHVMSGHFNTVLDTSHLSQGVSCLGGNDQHLVVCTTKNKLFVWDAMKPTPSLLKTAPTEKGHYTTTQICTGDEHTLILRHRLTPQKYSSSVVESVIYGWGSNFNSQLGELSSMDVKRDLRVESSKQRSITVPTEIPIPYMKDQTIIIKVAAGTSHSLALANDGVVYSWGSNTKGACAVPSEILQISDPTPCPRLFQITNICAHRDSSSAITKFGDIFVWGHSPIEVKSSAVSLPPEVQLFYEPTRLRAPKTIKTSQPRSGNSEDWSYLLQPSGLPRFCEVAVSIDIGFGIGTDELLYCWSLSQRPSIAYLVRNTPPNLANVLIALNLLHVINARGLVFTAKLPLDGSKAQPGDGSWRPGPMHFTPSRWLTGAVDIAGFAALCRVWLPPPPLISYYGSWDSRPSDWDKIPCCLGLQTDLNAPQFNEDWKGGDDYLTHSFKNSPPIKPSKDPAIPSPDHLNQWVKKFGKVEKKDEEDDEFPELTEAVATSLIKTSIAPYPSLRELSSAKLCRAIGPSNVLYLLKLFRASNALEAYDFVVQYICANLALLLADDVVVGFEKEDIAAVQWWILALNGGVADVATPSDVIRNAKLMEAMEELELQELKELVRWWKELNEIAASQKELENAKSSILYQGNTHRGDTWIGDKSDRIVELMLRASNPLAPANMTYRFGGLCLDQETIQQYTMKSSMMSSTEDKQRLECRAPVKLSPDDDLRVVLGEKRFNEFERLLKDVRNARKRLRKRQKLNSTNIPLSSSSHVLPSDELTESTLASLELNKLSEVELLHEVLKSRLHVEYNIREDEIDLYLQKLHTSRLTTAEVDQTECHTNLEATTLLIQHPLISNQEINDSTSDDVPHPRPNQISNQPCDSTIILPSPSLSESMLLPTETNQPTISCNPPQPSQPAEVSESFPVEPSHSTSSFSAPDPFFPDIEIPHQSHSGKRLPTARQKHGSNATKIVLTGGGLPRIAPSTTLKPPTEPSSPVDPRPKAIPFSWKIPLSAKPNVSETAFQLASQSSDLSSKARNPVADLQKGRKTEPFSRSAMGLAWGVSSIANRLSVTPDLIKIQQEEKRQKEEEESVRLVEEYERREALELQTLIDSIHHATMTPDEEHRQRRAGRREAQHRGRLKTPNGFW